MLQTDEFGIEALPLLRELLVAVHRWSASSPIDPDLVAVVRNRALGANHRRYLANIPAYARMAREACIGDDAAPEEIRDGLVITDDWFKSYDPAALDGGFSALTGWLETISTLRPAGTPVHAADLASWRAELRGRGTFVTLSSGTMGYPSLVPRDEVTLAALRNSSGLRLPWALTEGDYDCVLLTPAGMGSGIQSGAAGLAAGARRVQRLDSPGTADFLRAAAAEYRKVIVYGPPAGLAVLVDELPPVRLPPGSCVVTGGGWKQATPLDLASLLDTASDLFGIARRHCVDTYSTAELNTVFVTCAEGRYHVPPGVEAVVVDELLRPRRGPDVDGRLAVLDPFALAYPGLLATSDQVRLREGCACGLSGQTLLPPITRLPGAPARGCGTVGVVGQR